MKGLTLGPSQPSCRGGPQRLDSLKDALVLAICLVLFLPYSLSAQIPPIERSALIALYNSTEGENWRIQEGWLGPPGTEGDWYGLEVQDGHVIKVDLSSNNLKGKLPRQIGDLSELLWLNLSGRQGGGFWIYVENHISGWITTWIGRLEKLEFLDLSSNEFSGPIPTTIGNLSRLQRLDLSDNKLREIPAEIGSLSELQDLDLSGNQLNRLPEEIGKLRQLQELRVLRNNFTSLPSSIGDLLNLTTLYVNSNRLTVLPESIGDLVNLKTFFTTGNQLQSLPGSIGSLVNLIDLNLGQNQLTSLPVELGQLVQLRSLSLWRNPRLTLLPSTIGKLAQLQYLRIGGTRLTQIPPEVSQIKTLESVDFSDGFYQELPRGIDNFRWAKTLDLSDNHLRDLPAELANMTALESLNVCKNGLTTLPRILTRIPNLSGLCFHGNPLRGPIPAYIDEFTFLRFLRLDRFNFSGPIPPQIGNMTWLRGLDLSRNQLSGEIPVELTRLTDLEWLSVRENQFSGRIPPPELGLMSSLQTLDLSRNNLSGIIPPELGSLSNLRELNLSRNELSGEISPGLGGVEKLDLSENQLTGRIPEEFGNGRLGFLGLCANLLSGPVPDALFQLAAWNLRLDWNALSSETPASDPHRFHQRQTIPPGDLRVTRVTGTTVTLNWTPIEFFFFEGGYEVYYSIDPKGPYQLFDRTRDKTKDSVTVTGLDSDTPYYLALKSVSESHDFNRNIVTSEASQQVSARTSGSAEIYFPLLLSGSGTLTGLAVASDTDTGISLSYEAFDASGQSLLGSSNPIHQVLLPRSQEASLSRNLLNLDPTLPTAGWIKVTADNSRFGAAFQIGADGRLDGGAAFGATAKKIYFTRVLDAPQAFRGQKASTLLSIVNPNPWPVEVTLTHTPRRITKNQTIPENGMILKSPRELFGQDLSGGYIDVLVRSGGVGVAGLEWIELPDAGTWFALPAQPQVQSRQLYSAQVALGSDIFTDVQLVNTTKYPRKVTISFIEDASSSPRKVSTFTLAGNAYISRDVQEMLGSDELPMILQGSLRIDADRPGLVGDVIFGDRQGFRYAAGLALQGPGIQSALFTHVVNTAEVYTAFALFNPGPDTAEVRLEAFSRSGLLTGSARLVLQSGGRVSETLSSLIPAARNQTGYLRLESSAPIAVQQLFGTPDLKWLSATSPSRIKGAEVQLR